jgi:hypothetical protein
MPVLVEDSCGAGAIATGRSDGPSQQPSWLVDLPSLAILSLVVGVANEYARGGAEIASAVGAAPLCPSQDSLLPFRSRSKSQSFSLCTAGPLSPTVSSGEASCHLLDSSLLFNIHIPIFDVPSSSDALRHHHQEANDVSGIGGNQTGVDSSSLQKRIFLPHFWLLSFHWNF